MFAILSLVETDKAEFAEKGTFFANRFPSLRTFVNKKDGIWNNYVSPPSIHTTFKTDVIKVVLVFLISSFFINKKFQGRKSVGEISTYLLPQIWLLMFKGQYFC